VYSFSILCYNALRNTEILYKFTGDKMKTKNYTNFKTSNYHGQIKNDWTYFWFEHNELGEMDGGSADIELDYDGLHQLTGWFILDVNNCFDVAEEVKKHIDKLFDTWEFTKLQIGKVY
tara:strand:+ start:42 stop:395 length:354 start_codon:yes stop_codon:yes gene_type:complete